MCSRFYYKRDFDSKLNSVLNEYGLEVSGTESCDVHPSEQSVALYDRSGKPALKDMYWGYTNPYDKGLIINARSESVMEKRLFSDSILSRRCIIPASGFYEWDRNRSRFRFSAPDDGLIFLAGIYRRELDRDRYVILTSDANESMAPVHDRMPVMLKYDEIFSWITDKDRIDEFISRPQMELLREQDEGQISMIF